VKRIFLAILILWVFIPCAYCESPKYGISDLGTFDASDGRPRTIWPRAAGFIADGSTGKRNVKTKTEDDQACEACLQYALPKLKYVRTVKWDPQAKAEGSGTFLVVGFRTAKGPSGNVMQQVTCRVQKSTQGWNLKMLQIFHEASKTGRDVFEVHK
jgi:hypothetical protein